ncbi:MAG: hypothetical protein HY784_00970 [Chloroflexi bacterium]|nr:hypothetical protein [Chloroflexota bacterium]
MKKTPTFKSVEEEVIFWETHSLADYWDELEDVQIEANLRPEQLPLQITVLKESTAVCPLDHSRLLRTLSDFSDWSREGYGHRFFAPATAREIEAVFESDRIGHLQPDETMSVPVVVLQPASA